MSIYYLSISPRTQLTTSSTSPRINRHIHPSESSSPLLSSPLKHALPNGYHLPRHWLSTSCHCITCRLYSIATSYITLTYQQTPIDALATREAILETNLGGVLAAAASKRDDSDVASESFDSHLQEAGGRGKGGFGGGRNGGGNGNGRKGKCYRDALANNGKGGKGKCYRDAFPEVYNDIAIQNRAPAAAGAGAAEVLERGDDDDEISSDKLQTDTLGWGRCRRGLDLVDTTGLCCKRGLDGACCNGWILKRDDDDANDKLQVDGWGNSGRCRRTLSGIGRCCVGGY